MHDLAENELCATFTEEGLLVLMKDGDVFKVIHHDVGRDEEVKEFPIFDIAKAYYLNKVADMI